MARTATRAIIGAILMTGTTACGQSFTAEGPGAAGGGAAGAGGASSSSGSGGAGGCGAPPCSTCPDVALGALKDDFEDGVASSAWIPYQTDGATVREVAGELRVDAAVDATPPAEAGYFTSGVFAFAGCAVSVRLRSAASEQGQPGALTYVQLTSATDAAAVAFTVSDGQLRFAHSEDGSAIEAGSVEYDPTSQAYLRFSDTAGTMHLQTSPDGHAWTDQLTLDSPSFLTASRYRLGAGVTQAPEVPVTARFDDVNLIP